jgi:multiple antibiotic resistance protein
MSFLQIAISLFLVLNSIGNVPIFISLLSKYPLQRQRFITLRESLIALVILLLFNFFGDAILSLIGVTEPMIRVAGGILLFVIAIGMIFPQEREEPIPKYEPLIVPLAMPLFAGPGVLASVMVYTEHTHDPFMMSLAIFAAWAPSLIILLAASYIKKALGEKGVIACGKLGGMLICLISVKMFFTGAIELIRECL